MGKPRENQPRSRRGNFFIAKKQNLSSPSKHSQFDKETSTSSGSFFVSSSEKQQILQQREGKRNGRQKFAEKERTKPDVAEKDMKPKKEFDKKKWRLQKYSKKYKLQQWEEKRKKAVLNEYYKQVKDDGPKLDVKAIYKRYNVDDGDDEDVKQDDGEEIENENNLNSDITDAQANPDSEDSQPNTSQARKTKAFKKAHVEYQRLQDERKQKKEEFLRVKAEKAEALKEYKQKKLEKYKKLNKKTKKGQPIMKYRMEMLLEQIQKSVQ